MPKQNRLKEKMLFDVGLQWLNDHKIVHKNRGCFYIINSG